MKRLPLTTTILGTAAILLFSTITPYSGIAYAETDEEDENDECDEKCIAEFHIPDYDKPFAPITFNKKSYTWGSQVRVIIYAPSWNQDKNNIDFIGDDATLPIKISTRGHSIEPYKFIELGPNTGQFFGKFKLTGFSHDADGDGISDLKPSTSGAGPYKGRLECDRSDAVTVSFEAVDGVVLVNSAPIVWELGKVKFDQTSYKPNTNAIITVSDQDMNLIHNRLNTVKVDAYSDSDSGGTIITAVETDVNTGIFEGHITFTQTDNSNGDRLFVSDGDSIYARYTDRTAPEPYSIEDEVDIVAQSTFSPDTSTSNKITQQNLRVLDSQGNLLNSAEEGYQIFIQSNLINNIENPLQFAYLVQIKNENDDVINLSWMTGSIQPLQSMDVSQSWIPTQKGNYKIETFVWDSIADPMSLAKNQMIEFTIS